MRPKEENLPRSCGVGQLLVPLLDHKISLLPMAAMYREEHVPPPSIQKVLQPNREELTVSTHASLAEKGIPGFLNMFCRSLAACLALLSRSIL